MAAVGSMRPIKLCVPSMSNGMSRRRGYITSRSAVRSSSVGWPAKGGKVVAAVAKIAVISSGIMLAAVRIRWGWVRSGASHDQLR